ncbi:hypothetical protein C8Q80DRAFT_380398 [Daedaleopsis nitida]|nr:hypothetical protein C8Q80DRAFT_380398 [Daedaleopsis nitida]
MARCSKGAVQVASRGSGGNVATHPAGLETFVHDHSRHRTPKNSTPGTNVDDVSSEEYEGREERCRLISVTRLPSDPLACRTQSPNRGIIGRDNTDDGTSSEKAYRGIWRVCCAGHAHGREGAPAGRRAIAPCDGGRARRENTLCEARFRGSMSKFGSFCRMRCRPASRILPREQSLGVHPHGKRFAASGTMCRHVRKKRLELENQGR